jgi:phosphatase NudJ
MRVIFYGRPRNEDQLPKSIPDYESVGAVWASANDVAPESGLPLRGREPQQWFAYVAQGGTIHPLSLLTGEGASAAASSSSSSSRRPQS